MLFAGLLGEEELTLSNKLCSRWPQKARCSTARIPAACSESSRADVSTWSNQNSASPKLLPCVDVDDAPADVGAPLWLPTGDW